MGDETVERHGLRLVRCEPYNARLTDRSCVARWEEAERIVDDSGAGTSVRANQIRLCKGCPDGKKRSARLKD